MVHYTKDNKARSASGPARVGAPLPQGPRSGRAQPLPDLLAYQPGQDHPQVMEATGYSRGWIQQLARRYNSDGPEALGDRRHRNPGARDRALLDRVQQRD